MVPEQPTVVKLDLLEPIDYQVLDRLEVSKKEEIDHEGKSSVLTYVFPVGSLLGLISAALKFAKSSSHGAAS